MIASQRSCAAKVPHRGRLGGGLIVRTIVDLVQNPPGEITTYNNLRLGIEEAAK